MSATAAPLDVMVETLRADPRCRDFALTRTVKKLYRAIADQGPIEVLAITHPSTSTEFFVGWTDEGQHRLDILRPGPERDRRIASDDLERPSWTESYARYRDDLLNRRAYLFHAHGTLEPDLAAPFYGVWVAEEASLHRPGHDDFGETRSDGREGLCRGMYASSVPGEVVDWLVGAIAGLESPIDDGPLESLQAEQAELKAWPSRVRAAANAAEFVRINPEAGRLRDQLDAERLYAMFPRDNRGRLKARQRVLLQAVAPGAERDRLPWVTAIGPARAGGEEITVGVENLIAANQLERFDLAPWCWRKDAGPLDAPQTWGYTSRWDMAVSLLLDGRVKDGLEASGLRLDEAVSNLSRGSHIGLLHPDPDWPKVTRERLCRLAPWLLLGPGLDYARTLLKRKADGLRLFTLPNQSAVRKASIVLVPGTQPSLEIRWTGSNARLPLVLWQRPAIPGVYTPGR